MTAQTLLHHAPEPVQLDRARTYQQSDLRMFGKPTGLWVSVEGEYDWRWWCTEEQWGTETLANTHHVTLAATANILQLTQPDDLVTFQRQYGARVRWDDREPAIDWQSVAAQHDGILIAPYQWVHRLNLSWYYGWDCASGCVWNLDAIDGFALLDGADQ